MPINRWWESELVRRHLSNEARSEHCPVPGLWSECANGL
jgi:hypothetical protein